jgi:hypothetical protein
MSGELIIVCVVPAVAPRRVLRFEADYGVSPEVVWDALVDPVLVEGWLGRLVVDAAPEGEYTLVWPDAPPEKGAASAWSGSIVVIAPPKGRAPAVLELDFPPHVGLRFQLDRIPSAVHGRTRLMLEYASFVDSAAVPGLERFWRRRLGSLAELLRGRPRDWSD